MGRQRQLVVYKEDHAAMVTEESTPALHLHTPTLDSTMKLTFLLLLGEFLSVNNIIILFAASTFRFLCLVTLRPSVNASFCCLLYNIRKT